MLISSSTFCFTGAPSTAGCPSFNNVNGKQYYFVNTPATWTDAKAACASCGARLAEPMTAGENADILQLTINVGGSATTNVWLGITTTDGARYYFNFGKICPLIKSMQNCNFSAMIVFHLAGKTSNHINLSHIWPLFNILLLPLNHQRELTRSTYLKRSLSDNNSC